MFELSTLPSMTRPHQHRYPNSNKEWGIRGPKLGVGFKPKSQKAEIDWGNRTERLLNRPALLGLNPLIIDEQAGVDRYAARE